MLTLAMAQHQSHFNAGVLHNIDAVPANYIPAVRAASFLLIKRCGFLKKEEGSNVVVR